MKRLLFFFLFGLSLFADDDFDIYMGKETKHWLFLERPEDIAHLKLFKQIYDKYYALLKKGSNEEKIPKVIHFIWLGPRPFPTESVENVRMWMGEHADWRVKFWTDRDRPLPCVGMERVMIDQFSFCLLEKEYKTSTNWGEKSDILRYEILFQEGGIYVDHDANCLTSFTLLNEAFDLFCGLEAPHPPLAGEVITCGNGVIGSRPGHIVIEQTLKNIAQRWESVGRIYRGEDGFNRTERVLNRTYTALTEAVKEKVGREGNRDIVLPAAYFFAKGGIKPLYSEHFYANAWADSDAYDAFARQSKLLGKIEHKITMLYQVLAVILAIQFIVFVLMFRKRSVVNRIDSKFSIGKKFIAKVR